MVRPGRGKRTALATGALGIFVLVWAAFAGRSAILEWLDDLAYRFDLPWRKKPFKVKVDWSHPSFRTAVLSGGRGGEAEAVPAEVVRAAQEIFRRTTLPYLEDPTEWEHKGLVRLREEQYGRLFRFPTPGGLSVFAFRVPDLGPSHRVCILVHDPITRRTTPRPVCVGGSCISEKALAGVPDGLVEGSPVSFDDLDLDGRPEVLVQEPEHRGTGFNFAVFHYLRVGEDLSLIQIAVREGWRSQRWGPDDFGRLRRDFEKVGPGRIGLAVRIEHAPGKGPPQEIGRVFYESSGPGAPFRETGRTPVLEEHARYLQEMAVDESSLEPPMALEP